MYLSEFCYLMVTDDRIKENLNHEFVKKVRNIL